MMTNYVLHLAHHYKHLVPVISTSISPSVLMFHINISRFARQLLPCVTNDLPWIMFNKQCEQQVRFVISDFNVTKFRMLPFSN